MYKLNGIDLTTYGIIGSMVSPSNISVSGCFSMPKRTGDCFYEWGDENGVEGYTDADEIMFEGRDITFNSILLVNNFDLYYKLKVLYTDIATFTDLVVFSTPYGDFNVQVIDVIETHNTSGSWVTIRMREPVVDLSGGTLPSTGSGSYTIDDIPFTSFGLYVNKSDKAFNLPELKEQYFTKYGQEGYQIGYHKNRTLTIDGTIMADDTDAFLINIKNLYLAFSSEGEREIKKNNEVRLKCFATEGFEVSEVMVFNNVVIGRFSIELIVTDFVDGRYLLLENEDYVNTENELFILI